MMVLTAFWVPVGVIFGGLGGVLEALWVLLGGSSAHVLVWPVLAALLGQTLAI